MSTKLTGGHTVSILCVEPGHDGMIVTGAEEGELTVWDSQGAVLHKKQFDGIGDVTSVCASKQNTNLIYVSCGVTIFCIDLREFQNPVREIKVNEEEINQIKLNESENYLAACDDSGMIKLINVFDWKVYKTLRKHTNIASSVIFRPKRTWDLLSAGFDCQLIQWDFSKSRPYCTIDMNDFGETRDNVTSYLVSPPFIHSMDINSDGSLVACATENGHVKLFQSNKRNLAFNCNLTGHTASVSQVHFPKFEGGEHILLSAANDSRVFIWNTKDVRVGKLLENGHASTSDGAEPGPVPTNECQPQHIIAHGMKPNYISSAIVNQQKYIYVADSSTDITRYNFTE